MILACHNISKAFGDQIIVKSGTFHIEEREKAAASCNTRKEFHKKYQWAHYLASQNEGELDEICSHMPKPNRWTDELLIELASKCSNMKELKELNFKAYIHVTHTKGKSSFVRGYFKKKRIS